MIEPLDGGSTSVEDFVGAAFGDLSSPAEPTAASTSESPPAAPAAEAAPPADATAEVPKDDAVPDAAPPATPAAATPEPPADDPLASATPFTYKVDGQTKTFDGIKVLGEDGGIIDPSAMPGLAQVISEHGHLKTANQQLYQQVQQYEAVGGMAKFQQVNEERAVLDAVGQVLVPLFVGTKGEAPDVNQVLRLLVRNEDGSISWNEDARQLLAGRIGNSVERAKLEAGRSFSSVQTRAVNQEQEAQQAERLANEAVSEGLKTLRSTFKDWSAEDFQAAERHITHFKDAYVRKASPSDVQKYPHLQVGQTFIDLPRLQPWVDERQGFKAQTKQTTTTVTKAAQENAARLLTASRNKPSTPAKPAADKAPSRAAEASDAWDLMEGLAARSIRATP